MDAPTPHRQSKLLSLLRDHGFLNINQMSAHLGVSIVTVRRDLTELASRGLLKRTHGGAIVAEQVTADKENAARALEFASEKQRIGAAAAEMVVDGDTVIIDAGTTSCEVARFLIQKRELTVITNSLDAAAMLGPTLNNRLFVVGGEFLNVNHSFAGPMAAEMVRRFSADKAFLSVASIDLDRGVIGIASQQSASVQQAMIEVSKVTAVVAVHDKFGRASLAVTRALKDIDLVISDTAVSDEQEALVRAHGSQLIRV